jgi:hypothetical protein
MRLRARLVIVREDRTAGGRLKQRRDPTNPWKARLLDRGIADYLESRQQKPFKLKGVCPAAELLNGPP